MSRTATIFLLLIFHLFVPLLMVSGAVNKRRQSETEKILDLRLHTITIVTPLQLTDNTLFEVDLSTGSNKQYDEPKRKSVAIC